MRFARGEISSYPVIPEQELPQFAEVDQRRDITYAVVSEVEICEVRELSKQRKFSIAHLLTVSWRTVYNRPEPLMRLL